MMKHIFVRGIILLVGICMFGPLTSEAAEHKFGGRIMNDWVFWTERDNEVEDAVGTLEDGTEFRRARLFVSGTLYEQVNYKLQLDFAGGDADLKDAYMSLTKLAAVGSVKVGHFKEPFGLEQLTSSKYITFLERSLPDVFAPGRSTGIMFNNSVLENRATWAVGGFRDADSYGDSDDEDSNFDVTARLTALPWYGNEGRQLLHVGAAYSIRRPDGDSLRYRQRPEIHLSPRFVDTESISADGVNLLGVEAAFVLGPASLQAEYMMADVDATSGSNPDFSGYYVMASYWLTGQEHRTYKTSSGTFSRVKPSENFLGDEGGAGAWELAVRYSALDLKDTWVTTTDEDETVEDTHGGELDNVTVGLNWHLNPKTRVMWNYVMADLNNVGDADAATMRFQVDF